MFVDVAPEAGRVAERSVTVGSRALEGHLPGVNPHVDAEVVGLVEAVATMAAVERTLLRVRALMHAKIGGMPELLLAGLAPELYSNKASTVITRTVKK